MALCRRIRGEFHDSEMRWSFNRRPKLSSQILSGSLFLHFLAALVEDLTPDRLCVWLPFYFMFYFTCHLSNPLIWRTDNTESVRRLWITARKRRATHRKHQNMEVHNTECSVTWTLLLRGCWQLKPALPGVVLTGCLFSNPDWTSTPTPFPLSHQTAEQTPTTGILLWHHWAISEPGLHPHRLRAAEKGWAKPVRFNRPWAGWGPLSKPQPSDDFSPVFYKSVYYVCFCSCPAHGRKTLKYCSVKKRSRRRRMIKGSNADKWVGITPLLLWCQILWWLLIKSHRISQSVYESLFLPDTAFFQPK